MDGGKGGGGGTCIIRGLGQVAGGSGSCGAGPGACAVLHVHAVGVVGWVDVSVGVASRTFSKQQQSLDSRTRHSSPPPPNTI